MNFCPNCGSKLKDDLSFCASCGYVFQEYKAPDYSGMDNPFENVSGSYKSAASALDQEAEEAAHKNPFEYERSEEARKDTYQEHTGSSCRQYENKTAGFASERARQDYSRASEPNYGTGYMDTAPKTNIYGLISLICGIAGIPLFFLLLIPNILAIVFGIIGLNYAKNNLTGKGTSIAGIILGCIMIAVFVLIIVISVLFFSVVNLPGIL